LAFKLTQGVIGMANRIGVGIFIDHISLPDCQKSIERHHYSHQVRDICYDSVQRAYL
jgi:hypothetical protein